MEIINKPVPFGEFLRDRLRERKIEPGAIVDNLPDTLRLSWLAFQEQRRGLYNWANATKPSKENETLLVPRTGVEGHLYDLRDKNGNLVPPREALFELARIAQKLLNAWARNHRGDGVLLQMERALFNDQPSVRGIVNIDIFWGQAVFQVKQLFVESPKRRQYRRETYDGVEPLLSGLKYDKDTGITEEYPIPDTARKITSTYPPVSLPWEELKENRSGMRFLSEAGRAADPYARKAIDIICITGYAGQNFIMRDNIFHKEDRKR